MNGIDRRNLIRAMVQSRVGPSPRSKKLAWRRRDRAVRTALGHCSHCNSGPAKHGSRKCEECARRSSWWGCKEYMTRLQRGQCGCGDPVVPGKTQCPTCAEANRLGARARRAARKQASNEGV